MITTMGVGVIVIFSFIFLLYSNSFLMKRRQKELGLYNILRFGKEAYQQGYDAGESV